MGDAAGFGLDHLPYGVVRAADGQLVPVVRYTDRYLDLSTIDDALFGSGTLDAFLSAGPETWAQVRAAATDAIAADRAPLAALATTTPVLGYTVADYVDFYASEQHAANAGRIFRRGTPDPLPPHWKQLPMGYHGRAGSLVVSGTPVRRPYGQFPVAGPAAQSVHFEPTRCLDFEAEVAFVVGRGSDGPVAVTDLSRHVLGVSLLNDWSARDVQRFETVPLGPLLGKSFATSISAWITPLEALEHAWRPPPPRDVEPPRHLADHDLPGGLDLDLTVSINGTVVSRPPFATMYWTGGQLLAHLTSNGARLRRGDVVASGTVSGPDPGQFGSLLELGWNGTRPVSVGAQTRTWLEDGDEVVVTATAPGRDGPLQLGEVSGRVEPAGRYAADRPYGR